MKEFEDKTKSMPNDDSLQGASAVDAKDTEAQPAPAGSAVSPASPPSPVSPVVPQPAPPVSPAPVVPPVPLKTQSRALPYVMAVVTMLLTSILQSAISSIATNYRFDGGLVSDPVLFNALPWIQTLLSGLLGLVLPIVAGLITYKKFRPALRFWLILLGAQTILLLPQNILNLVFAVLTAESSAVLFASLVNGLHILFSLLAPALACLMLWYFDRKAE